MTADGGEVKPEAPSHRPAVAFPYTGSRARRADRQAHPEVY